MEIGQNGGTLLVGVDGSGYSRAALAYAVLEAGRRGGRVRAVHVYPPLRFLSVPHAPPAPPTPEWVVADYEDEIRRMVGEIVTEHPGDGVDVPVAAEALPGRPARVLLEQAGDAAELVVGHRGLGAVTGALLGSVSVQCVLYAPCTVTVVRGNPALAGASEQPAAVG